jgi:uncharacterized phage protein (TIGR02218 family)
MIELYEFTHGGTTYRYTSADRAIVYDSETWTAVPVGRSDRQGDAVEDQKNILSVTVPHDNEVARLYLKRPPDKPVRMRLYRGLTVDEIAIVLTARVTGVRWSGYEATIECSSPLLQAARSGLKARYSSQCRHALYSRGCGVNPDDVEDSFLFVQLELDDTRVKTTGLADPGADLYTGGVLTIGEERRVILGHEYALVDSVHTIWFDVDRPFVAPITVGDTVKALPGCDHDVATCRDKFSNLANFGGFPTIPEANPFTRRINLPAG